MRALVLADSEERVEFLNTVLWTYNPNAFLPHGSAKDGRANEQPIYLATQIPSKIDKVESDDATSNPFSILFVTDGTMVESSSAYTRIIDIFDGQNEEATANARTRWKSYQAAGHAIAYYKQTAAGGWEKAA